MSCSSGDGISVDLLLRHGASPSATDNQGMTALHWAAVKGSSPCIHHLIQAGADLWVKEAAGKTPRDMAEELKGLIPFERGLEEAGYSSSGFPKRGKLSDVGYTAVLLKFGC